LTYHEEHVFNLISFVLHTVILRYLH
jgi:hypothetical protein